MKRIAAWPEGSSASQLNATGIVVRILIGEQLLVALVGIGGGLWPSQSALLLHLLIGGQLCLDALGIFSLVALAGFKVDHPRLLAGTLLVLTAAAVAKNVHVSVISASTDFARLVVPLMWISVTPVEDFGSQFLAELAKVRYVLIAILLAQVGGLAAGRLHGWGAAYLSGDPIIGLLVFPSILDGSDLVAQSLVALTTIPLLIVSLKRTAWLSAGVVVVMLAISSVGTISRSVVLRFGVVASLGVLVVVLFAVAIGSGSRVTQRAETITTIAANSGSDYSFSQRLEEISAQLDRLKSNPVPSILFGLSSEEVRLPNGQATHAIHATPFFLLFAGGAVWVFAFALAGRSVRRSGCELNWVLIWVSVGILIDSFGGNDSLAPSFGIALAVLHALARALIWRRHGSK